MTQDDALDRAIGEWLMRKEAEPSLLPGEFARGLDGPLRTAFLRELEALAAIDQLATQAPPRDLPRRFGDFRVLGELGRGAMGVVFDAEQVSSGQRVALKVMHAHVARDLHSASRFQREARTAAALQHPGIVPVLGFGETDGSSWLAMARVDGRSLQRLLVASADGRDVDHALARRLLDDPRRLAQSIADAADALEFAHRHNVVHRDVKPANLMCCDDGRMVVLDFGLATARDADAPTLTRSGDLLGTPLYMAPEQARGAQNGTAASDVYSLGAVLYECLCGRPPVDGGPLASVIDAILNRDPVDPRRVRSSVPEDLARIALQCLEKEPERRYASAAALADDLRRFVDGSSVQARRSSVLHRSLRQIRRRPGVAALAATVLVLLPMALLAWSWATASDAQAVRLQRERDLRSIGELLGGAPERLTAFGGASLRFYARLGLGDHLVERLPRSADAERALALADDLVLRHPDDVGVLRARARARLDVGDDPAAADAAVASLLAHPSATAADRTMAAVWAGRNGNATPGAVGQGGPEKPDGEADAEQAYWRAFLAQDQQRYADAIEQFTLALAAPDLDPELRYYAYLHRGWARTCPDTLDLDAAADDLLRAATLRPRFRTADLLWAALKCLTAQTADDLGAPVQRVQDTLRDAPSWVCVLTARVLLALAEGGTQQAGPLSFGAEFSPIAVLPVRAEFAAAFAGLALQRLEDVAKSEPAAFEAGFHRITALALLGRHDEALTVADELQATHPERVPVVDLQRARVHLAAGRPQRARELVERSLDRDPRLVAGWRFSAELAGHVGDVERQLDALERAAAHLAQMQREPSVFPDAAAMLPELHLQRARILLRIGRTAEAVEILQHVELGSAAERLAPRIAAQRAVLLQSGGAAVPAEVRAAAAAVPATSPLRWLAADATGVPTVVDASVRAALRRDWLPAAASARLSAADHGDAVPDVAKAPLARLLRHVEAILSAPQGAAVLLQRAEAALAADPDNGEARVLRALVLYRTQRSRQAAEFLGSTLAAHPDDLRSRYLLAVVAREIDDPVLLRTALRRGRSLATAAELDRAAAALPVRLAVVGADLLGSLR
jgi:tetratricopeptide (TPR) repeat protein/tRNA A-37 threonylcarbamoyl transferase component Bud32